MNDDLDSLENRIESARIDLSKVYKEYETQLADNPSDREACARLRRKIAKMEVKLEYLREKK